MADEIRASVSISRNLIEGVEVREDIHGIVERFAKASLYRNTSAQLPKLRRELLAALQRKWLPFARMVGQASAEPILKELGGTKLVDKGNTLRGRILNDQQRFQRGNLLSFREALNREVGTLSGDINLAFANATRDKVLKKQLIADLVAADRDELAQLAKAHKRLDAATEQVQRAEESLSKLGKRAKKGRRRANAQLKAAKSEVTKAKQSIRQTRGFYARFETRVQGRARDSIRREAQTAQFNTFRNAGFDTFTWIAVNAGDACPSCQGLHGETKTAAQWQAHGGPGAADTFCGTACMCVLSPEAHTENQPSLEDPIRLNAEDRLIANEEAQRLAQLAPGQA